MSCCKKNAGFTLIEVMIAVAIVGILAAIAYPSYQDSVRKGRRNDGMSTLLDAAQKLEVYRSRESSYTTTAGLANILTTSPEGYYGNLTIQAGGCGSIISCYTLQIAPTTLNSQNDDTVKGYSMTSTGVKQWLDDGGTWVDGWK